MLSQIRVVKEIDQAEQDSTELADRLHSFKHDMQLHTLTALSRAAFCTVFNA
jgi:hypothetical protein